MHHAGHRIAIPTSQLQKRRTTVSHAVGLAVIGILLLGLLFISQPTLSKATITFDQGMTLERAMPIWQASMSPPQTMKVSLTMTLSGFLQPKKFAVSGDDCIRNLTINGQRVTDVDDEHCSLAGQTIDLGPYLHAGTNSIEAYIPDSIGKQGFWISTSWWDPLMFSVALGALMSFVGALWILLSLRRSSAWTYSIAGIMSLGILLRILYFGVTPYIVRGNDAEGHADYIIYMMERRMLPPIHEGWQTYQPPLYYIVGATAGTFLRDAGYADWEVIRGVQFLSVLLSIGILFVALATGRLLFSSQWENVLWMACFSFFPGFIIYAAKLGNDALAQFLSFLLCLLCLIFWRATRPRGWVGLSLLCSAALLTKSSGAVFVPIIIVLLVMHPRLSLIDKWRQGAIGVLLLVSLTAWFFIHRWLEDPAATMVGNIRWLNDALAVGNAPENYLTFRPSQVLAFPFIDTFDDATGRQYFLEFLYRSAFFGEFSFGASLKWLAKLLLAFGFGIVELMVLGCLLPGWRNFKKSFPLWLIGAVIAGLHVYFRSQFPFAPSQDIRYSAGILLPLFFFAIVGLRWFHGRWRLLPLGVLWGFVALCLVFDAAVIATDSL